MARPLIKYFASHDNWYYDTKKKFTSRLTRWQKRDPYPGMKDRKHRRSYYRNEINDRVDDILARGYGIFNAKKREKFPFVLAVLNGRITPSQAAYNFAVGRDDNDL